MKKLFFVDMELQPDPKQTFRSKIGRDMSVMDFAIQVCYPQVKILCFLLNFWTSEPEEI